VNALTEEIERRGYSARIEPGNGGERCIESLTGDEPIRKTLCNAIVADELEYLRLSGKVQQCATKHLFLRFL
jgi:hypothetical protein